MYCSHCGALLPEGARYCPACGMACEAQAQNESQHEPERGMFWYHVLIYFGLWVEAIANIATGVMLMIGAFGLKGFRIRQGVDLFPVARVLMVIYGVVLILFGAYIIYTRSRLARTRGNGPVCLYSIYLIDITLSAIRLAGLFLLRFELAALAAVHTCAQILASALLLTINYAYFSKREQLFYDEKRS